MRAPDPLAAAPGPAPAGVWHRLPGFCVALALAALVVPVLLVPLPPLLDLPNHLARLWLIAGGAGQAPLADMFAVDWSRAATNIGLDLLAAAFGAGLPVERLGMLAVGAALLLPPLGAVLLHRTAFGGWHWWQAGFAVFAWNATLLSGFLNFQIGLGLALLAAALAEAIRRAAGSAAALAAVTVLGAALLVWHVFALGFFAALAAGLAFGCAWPDGTAGRRRLAAFGRGAAAASAAALPLAGFLLLAPTAPGAHAPPGVYTPFAGYGLGPKAMTLASALVTYDARIDLVFCVGVAAVASLVARRAGGAAHAGLLLAAAGLVGLALLVPPAAADTAFVDWRFAVMALLCLLVAIRPAAGSARMAAVASCLLLALSAGRAGWTTSIWLAREPDRAALRTVLAGLPPGSAVLPVIRPAPRDAVQPPGRYFLFGTMPGFAHLGALAVPWRAAFVPTLFASPGRQPLRVLPPWDAMSSPEGAAAPLRLLEQPPATPWERYFFGHLVEWRTRFDHVLLLDLAPAGTAGPALSGVALRADAGFARLYRVLPPDGAAPR